MQPNPEHNTEPNLEYLENSLQNNKNGKLSEDQKSVIRKMFKMRTVTAWVLIVCGLFLLITCTPILFIKEGTENMSIFYVILVFVIAMLAITAYGFKIRATQKKLASEFEHIPVQNTRGTPAKNDYGAPVRAPIPGGPGTFLMVLPMKCGWIKMNDKKFGVLPGPLYKKITPRKEAKFYYLELDGSGFHKNLIVNYEL